MCKITLREGDGGGHDLFSNYARMCVEKGKTKTPFSFRQVS